MRFVHFSRIHKSLEKYDFVMKEYSNKIGMVFYLILEHLMLHKHAIWYGRSKIQIKDMFLLRHPFSCRPVFMSLFPVEFFGQFVSISVTKFSK